jgi:hypothetical protein
VKSLRTFLLACGFAVSACALGSSVARADVDRLLPEVKAPAPSTPLTDAEVEVFMGWFAVDEVFPDILAKAFDASDDTAGFSASQRTCVLGVVTPAFHDAMRDQFRGMLVDRENFVAWSEFRETTPGRRFMTFIRASMKAEFLGTSAPSSDGMFDDLADDDRAAVMRFLRSNALQALEASRDFEMDPQMKRRVQKETHKRCGVSI